MAVDPEQALPDHGNSIHSPSWGTQIATPTGLKSIEKLEIDDQVLAGSVSAAGGKLSIQWSVADLGFSSGTWPGRPSYCVDIHVGYTRLICEGELCVLLANGKYIRVNQLRAGMQLVDKNGASLKIRSVNKLPHSDGLHAVATKLPWNKHPDKHLLLANSVVIGDYMMMMEFDTLPDSMKEVV